jgi:hypothetical protein
MCLFGGEEGVFSAIYPKHDMKSYVVTMGLIFLSGEDA